MAYATFAQFITLYSRGLLDRVCTRAGDVDLNVTPDTEGRAGMALDSASGVMDSFFVGVYPVPLSVTYPSTLATLRNCCCALAIAELIIQRGYTVGSEDEQLVIQSRRQWLDWLSSVRNGKTQLPGVSTEQVDPDQLVPADGFFVTSEPAFFPPADRFA